jgi:hypothetical protein
MCEPSGIFGSNVESGAATAAKILVEAGALEMGDVTRFAAGGDALPPLVAQDTPSAGPDFEEWRRGVMAARARSKAPSAHPVPRRR